jgi:hypothetical protein
MTDALIFDSTEQTSYIFILHYFWSFGSYHLQLVSGWINERYIAIILIQINVIKLA